MYVCGQYDDDVCTEWATENCGNHETCKEGVCVPLPCQEDWVCEQWGECSLGIQARKCADWNECGEYESEPRLRRDCIEDEESEEEGLRIIEGPIEERPAFTMPGIERTSFENFILLASLVVFLTLLYQMLKAVKIIT